MSIRNTIQIIYGIPGILCYFLVLYAMYGIRKKLNRSIILVFIMISFTNVSTWLNAWVFLKLTNEPFFFGYYEFLKQHTILIEIHTFLVSHFYYAQNIDVFFLTLDRFAAFYIVEGNMRWWAKHYLAISVLTHLIAIGIQLAIRLPMETLLLFDPVNVRYVLATGPGDTHNETLDQWFQTAFGICIGVTCVALNAKSYKVLYHLRSTKSSGLKSPFLVIASCILITQILNFTVTTVIASRGLGGMISYADIKEIYEFMYVTSDIFSIGPALYTILLPGPIRAFLVKKIFPCWVSPSKRPATILVSTVQTNNNRTTVN